ncbi:MAG TPA: helix-turn-helix domain-containing protein [Acidimicrobiales bacterium]|nr:helix-turn-helix domain-containing protein [Acidimicrobiales bacterium]
MPTQLERRTATRAALLAAARALFTEKGFAATGREEIAERAGVTRGALYHHFESKRDAFAAVADELDAELATRVVAAARRAPSAYEQIRASCRAYVEAFAEPAVMRILLIEAAAALGPEWVRASNESACVTLLTPALRAAATEGHTIPGDVHIAAQLLLGMLNEAGAIIAASENPKAALRRVRPTVDALVERLLRG